MSAAGSPSRALAWEGCCNVRDLGGLPTEDGRETPAIEDWVAEAPDDAEKRKRRMLSAMPAVTMENVLEELERRHGSVRAFLVEAGADESLLDAFAVRLRV